MRDDAAPTVALLTAEQAAEIAEAAAKRALAKALREVRPTGPALVDTDALRLALNTSASTIARLRKEGMPTVMVGQSPRFEVAHVVAWLRDREAPGQ